MISGILNIVILAVFCQARLKLYIFTENFNSPLLNLKIMRNVVCLVSYFLKYNAPAIKKLLMQNNAIRPPS